MAKNTIVIRDEPEGDYRFDPMQDPDAHGLLKLPMPYHPFGTKVTDLRVVKLPASNDDAERALRELNAPTEVDSLQKPNSDLTARDDEKWIVIPRAPLSDAETVWHYTNSEGALGIISSGTLWATSISFLNDRGEYRYGMEMLNSLLQGVHDSKYIDKDRKQFISEVVQQMEDMREQNPLYLLCASEAADSLSQWRGYGGHANDHAVAHCLGFDGQTDGVIIDMAANSSIPKTLIYSPRWSKVLYDEDTQILFLLQTLGFLAAICPGPKSTWSKTDREAHMASCVARLIEALAHCKHPSFADEHEVRMLFSAPSDDRNVRYRAGKYGITPYLEVSFVDSNLYLPEEGNPSIISNPGKLPIHSIMIGPTDQKDLAQIGVKNLLASKGYLSVEMRHSASPFR